MQISVIKTTIECHHCHKKAKKGIVISGKIYAESCAADELGLSLSTLRQLVKNDKE